MKVALVPFRSIIGDFAGNLERTLKAARAAAAAGAELIVFPELSLVGYSAQDLLLRPGFLASAMEQFKELEREYRADKKLNKCALVVGTLLPAPAQAPRPSFNAAACLIGERTEFRVKTLLPDYDVFNEGRVFVSGFEWDTRAFVPIEFGGEKLGLLVCEDSWHEMQRQGRPQHKGLPIPTQEWKRSGATMLVNLSASPFSTAQQSRRRELIASEAKETGLPIYYVNHFGAQDEIIFDGDAFAFDAKGQLLSAGELFRGETVFTGGAKPKADETNELECLRRALVTGIRDYAEKNSFKKLVLGISGGIDSAVVAVLAAEAVGAENVLGISMPSKHSSIHSIEDAEALAKNLGIRYKNVPIKFVHSTLTMNLKDAFGAPPEGLTDENIQSRLRGVVVMGFANRMGALALATGNKSELAVGYGTLYGDLIGALAPIGDVYKTKVYELARFINRFQEIIPERTLTKAPSAELKPGQKDQDSLPPYDLLDGLLFALVDEEREPAEALKLLSKRFAGLNIELVNEIHRKVRLAEYKRRQAPPVLRVSDRAFGLGRRYPVTARY